MLGRIRTVTTKIKLYCTTARYIQYTIARGEIELRLDTFSDNPSIRYSQNSIDQGRSFSHFFYLYWIPLFIHHCPPKLKGIYPFNFLIYMASLSLLIFIAVTLLWDTQNLGPPMLLMTITWCTCTFFHYSHIRLYLLISCILLSFSLFL